MRANYITKFPMVCELCKRPLFRKETETAKNFSTRITCSKECAYIIKGLKRRGENHPLWKGNEVGYSTLHWWVREHLPPPKNCQICNKESSLDLANITGIYTRDFNNWKYMCRRCHMVSDGRLEEFIKNSVPYKRLHNND